MMRAAGVAVSGVILFSLGLPVPAAGADEKCGPDTPGVSKVKDSWAQQRLGFREVWKFTRGGGVAVGVVDSGVDDRHPQLKDQVMRAVDLTKTKKIDCVGHGTAVAGIIAAADFTGKGIPFAGVAPSAKIISVKQTQDEQDANGAGRLATAIRRAAELGAKVINVSIQAHDTPPLKSAVEYAVSKDVVLVAAAGNVQKEDGAQVPAFPASYDNVIGVGSAAQNGLIADSSNTTSNVSVLGPGKGITTLWPPRGYSRPIDGTSFAAPYVSGVAALVRARHPHLNQAQVRHRIIATADGTSGTGTGAGMVNPMQAVTALVPGEESARGDRPVVAGPEPEPVDFGPGTDADTRTLATSGAVTALALAAGGIAVGGALVIPLGRRRGWRAARRAVRD